MVGSLVIGVVLLASCHEVGPPPATGTLERDRVELIAPMQEEILTIAVREGQALAAGELVATLDTRRLDAQIAATTARRDQADAALRELLRGARAAEVERARDQLREAESALIAARPELNRARALVASEVGTAAELDRADSTLKVAIARRDSARATLELLLSGATAELLDQARARVAEVAAQLDELALLRERLRIVAPRAGVVDALPYEIGERPPAGATVAMLLVGPAPYARVYVPVDLRADVAPGASVVVTVEGVDGSFAGRVRTLSSEAAFTPYFALTERDRGRLSYLAEVDLVEERAAGLATGLPVVMVPSVP